MGRDKQIDDTSINPLPDQPERHTAAHFQNATYTDIKQSRVETTMNNTSTETTTGSTDTQGSVHHRSKLYGGIAALVVIAAAVAAGSKLLHQTPVSAARHLHPLSMSAGRSKESFTGGSSSLASSRP